MKNTADGGRGKVEVAEAVLNGDVMAELGMPWQDLLADGHGEGLPAYNTLYSTDPRRLPIAISDKFSGTGR